jgi:hypothetical protein
MAGAPSACDVVVPRDVDTIEAAIAEVTPPATVCLEAGRFESANGRRIALRDGVSLRGLEDAPASYICNGLDVSAATDLGLMLESLAIGGTVTGQTPVKLTVRDAFLNHVLSQCPAVEQGTPAIDLEFSDPTRELRLIVEQVAFFGPGVLIKSSSSSVPSRVHVEIRRSSCMGLQCWDLARLELGSLPSGSRFDMTIENSIVRNSVLQAIAVSALLENPEDEPGSSLRIVSNTIHSEGDPNYGIFLSGGLRAGGVIANNAIEDIANPLMIGDFPAVGNIASIGDADGWFQDTGSFIPATDSLLRGVAVAEQLPADDFHGRPRSALDVGACEYQEPRKDP